MENNYSFRNPSELKTFVFWANDRNLDFEMKKIHDRNHPGEHLDFLSLVFSGKNKPLNLQ